jgi:hypothetical protein
MKEYECSNLHMLHVLKEYRCSNLHMLHVLSAYLQNLHLHECIYKTWKKCLLGTNRCWSNILIVRYELTISDPSIWNLLGPRFTFGNQVELEWRGFIKVLELGLNWPLVLEGLKNQNQTCGSQGPIPSCDFN